MKQIEIYQIDLDIDYDEVAFKPFDKLEDTQGTDKIDSSIYVKVFSGEVNCENLSEIYTMFNIKHPEGYKGRSMSVSDILAVTENNETKYYYCDSIGFKEINFEPDETREMYITVVKCEPGKMAEVITINSELESLQENVGGGFIQAYYPFEEQVCIVCNDEGKINGMSLNRAIYDKGKITEIIAGPFFICDSSTTNFKSLSKEQQEKYLKQFKYPEQFIKVNGHILAIPFNPTKEKDKGEAR